MGAVKSLVLAAEEGDATAAATLRRLSATETLAVFAATFGGTLDAGWDQVGEEECRECHGEGVYEAVDHNLTRPWHLEPTYSEFPCDSCGGTGRAPVVVFTVRPAAPLVDAPKPTLVDLDDAHLPLVDDLPF